MSVNEAPREISPSRRVREIEDYGKLVEKLGAYGVGRMILSGRRNYYSKEEFQSDIERAIRDLGYRYVSFGLLRRFALDRLSEQPDLPLDKAIACVCARIADRIDFMSRNDRRCRNEIERAVEQIATSLRVFISDPTVENEAHCRRLLRSGGKRLATYREMMEGLSLVIE